MAAAQAGRPCAPTSVRLAREAFGAVEIAAAATRPRRVPAAAPDRRRLIASAWSSVVAASAIRCFAFERARPAARRSSTIGSRSGWIASSSFASSGPAAARICATSATGSHGAVRRCRPAAARAARRTRRGQRPAQATRRRERRIIVRSCGAGSRLRRLLRLLLRLSSSSPKPNQSRQPPRFLCRLRCCTVARRERRLEARRRRRSGAHPGNRRRWRWRRRPTASRGPCRRPPAARSAGARRCPTTRACAPVAPYRPVGWFWSLPTHTTARWSPV